MQVTFTHSLSCQLFVRRMYVHCLKCPYFAQTFVVQSVVEVLCLVVLNHACSCWQHSTCQRGTSYQDRNATHTHDLDLLSAAHRTHRVTTEDSLRRSLTPCTAFCKTTRHLNKVNILTIFSHKQNYISIEVRPSENAFLLL